MNPRARSRWWFVLWAFMCSVSTSNLAVALQNNSVGGYISAFLCLTLWHYLLSTRDAE